jgi:hypothetical protein
LRLERENFFGLVLDSDCNLPLDTKRRFAALYKTSASTSVKSRKMWTSTSILGFYLNYAELISTHFRLADVSGHAALIFRVLRKIVHIARKNMAFPSFRPFERACSDQTDFCKAYRNTGIDTASISCVCKKERSTNIFERDIVLAFVRVRDQMLTKRAVIQTGCTEYTYTALSCVSRACFLLNDTSQRLQGNGFLLSCISCTCFRRFPVCLN